jgi:hypothetical protein
VHASALGTVIGRGWATVDLDRAVVERTFDLAPGTSFEPAPASAALGATCLRGPAADGAGWIVLLEPATEGPIGAYLARHGEGWAVTWHATEQHGDLAPGPLGAEALDPGAPRWGPFRLRAVAATIAR